MIHWTACPHKWAMGEFVYGYTGEIYQDYECVLCGIHKVRPVNLHGACIDLQEDGEVDGISESDFDQYRKYQQADC